jgi:hypothetical protein
MFESCRGYIRTLSFTNLNMQARVRRGRENSRGFAFAALAA